MNGIKADRNCKKLTIFQKNSSYDLIINLQIRIHIFQPIDVFLANRKIKFIKNIQRKLTKREATKSKKWLIKLVKIKQKGEYNARYAPNTYNEISNKLTSFNSNYIREIKLLIKFNCSTKYVYALKKRNNHCCYRKLFKFLRIRI